jgi:hypothetical protein
VLVARDTGRLDATAAELTAAHGVEVRNESVDDVRAIRATPGQTPSVDQLQKLDNLRKELETISTYSRDGAPWRLRWFMYSGDDLYPPSRQAYFDQFSNLLFAETQGRLLTSLRTVKDKPDPTDAYEPTYNALKAYLITTSNPDKSTKEFLTPVLYSTWAAGRIGEEQTATLAHNQFDFYSGELLVSNPYSSNADTLAVGRARVAGDVDVADRIRHDVARIGEAGVRRELAVTVEVADSNVVDGFAGEVRDRRLESAIRVAKEDPRAAVAQSSVVTLAVTVDGVEYTRRPDRLLAIAGSNRRRHPQDARPIAPRVAGDFGGRRQRDSRHGARSIC